MITTEQRVIVERRPEAMAGVITLNRPQVLNALDQDTAEEILAAVAELDADADVRSLILTGAGDRAFCTGWDLNEASYLTANIETIDRKEFQARMDRLFRGFETTKPVIGAVNGYCIAGGMELALMCDMIVAAEEARFALQEVRWAIIPNGGGTQRLPRHVPRNLAFEWILTGEQFDATTALRVGLANRVVPRARVLDEALGLAATLAKRGPLAVRAAKESIARGVEMPLPQALDLEYELGDRLLETQDAKEGPKAFIEKREPRFEGR